MRGLMSIVKANDIKLLLLLFFLIEFKIFLEFSSLLNRLILSNSNEALKYNFL